MYYSSQLRISHSLFSFPLLAILSSMSLSEGQIPINSATVISDKDSSSEGELLSLHNTDRVINFGGVKWKFDAFSLVVPYSVTTHLTHPLSERRYDFWLDWHDMRDLPNARMHMYLGEPHGPSVTFATRLSRMERWAEAIQAYDSMMIEPEKRYAKEELESMIMSGILPRPKVVELDTGNKGLRKLFDRLQFPKPFDPSRPEESQQSQPTWVNFVESARSGELVCTWRKLKGK